MTGAAALPNDIDTLKALLLERDRVILDRDRIIREITNKLSWSEEKLQALELRYFGKKSEKYTPGEDKQNRLFDEAEAYADDSAQGIIEKVAVPAHERKKRGRKPKIDTLPVHEVIHELPDHDRACTCCGETRPEIGEDRTSEFDLVPAHVMKIVHVRRKYGPCTCESFAASGSRSIIVAPGPAKVVPGSDFTNRTIALFLTGKFADAVPFYRMAKILDRAGLVISRAALCKLAMSVGRSVADLIDLMNRDIVRSPVMLMDETTLKVLRNGEGPPGKSYMWVALGYLDGKPIHRFAYHAGRDGAFADTLLKGFSGYLQTDGYGGYHHLAGVGGIIHVSCFAHMRRKFVEAWEVAGKKGIAKEAIDLIARIYRIENELRGSMEAGTIDASVFLAARKERIGKVFGEFRTWLMDRALVVAPENKLGKAIAYAQHEFDDAIRFIEHPDLRPDTNLVENSIRPFVIGRKNYLFSGSPRGAHTSAGLYSLIQTAKANGHEPFAYLCYLFDRLPLCTTDQEREALLPYRLDPSTSKAYVA